AELEKKQSRHHDYIFAETSVEPHYWHNYTPARSVITSEGLHYIKNYHAGSRFITHIDNVERNEFYFDSWVADAQTNVRTAFLLNRYTYRPPEELFDLKQDPEEFRNLSGELSYGDRLNRFHGLIAKEFSRQGETEQMILEGTLPQFGHRSYTIRQDRGANEMSFNKKKWNPDTLYITALLD